MEESHASATAGQMDTASPVSGGTLKKKTSRKQKQGQRVTTAEQDPREVSDPTEDADLDSSKEMIQTRRSVGGSVAKKSFMPLVSGPSPTMQFGINEAFLVELRRSHIHQAIPDAAAERPSLLADEAVRQSIGAVSQGRCARSCHQFSRVRPLHLCAAHSFVCFRDNGDLVAVTPRCVLIYDRPPAACELSYKEPLYSIPVPDVSRVADLNDTSILMLRQGTFQISEERSSDELLVAEVSTNAIHVLAKIAVAMYSSWNCLLMMREQTSQKNSTECRGMQVNKREHKVYLLYHHHLAVIDLDMRLEPTVLRLRCRSEKTGPAVALIEFDHALYILTANSWLLATSKTGLFSMTPSSCCLNALLRLDSSLMAAHEIRSYAVDRRHYCAFFSVPKGRKLVSLRFPVPAGHGLDSEAASAPLMDCLVMQDRLYSTASCVDWVAAVPYALAWDATNEQLLVLEWGPENNGILISLDVFMEEGSFNSRRRHLIGPEKLPIRDRFPVVKSFSRFNAI